MGPVRMQPQILREASDVVATLLSGVLESHRNHRFLRAEESISHTHCQEGQERGSKEQLTNLPNTDLGKGDGTNPPMNHRYF